MEGVRRANAEGDAAEVTTQAVSALLYNYVRVRAAHRPSAGCRHPRELATTGYGRIASTDFWDLRCLAVKVIFFGTQNYPWVPDSFVDIPQAGDMLVSVSERL